VRCISVGGVAVSYHIGAITYFRNDVLRFFWCDPQPNPENTIEIPFTDDLWRFYYLPALELIPAEQIPIASALVTIPQADFQIGFYPEVLRLLVDEHWAEAKQWCVEHQQILHEAEFQPDGIRIVAGDTWSEPFEDNE
jgi:hypothetical protein